jgi:L-ascorbate metabolism protein UlaG (beta-lactamase superfamily)
MDLRSKLWAWRSAALLLFSAAGVWGAGCAFSGPRYHGPPSDHFDGKRFHNQVDHPRAGFADLVRWLSSRNPGPWRDWVESEPGLPPPRKVEGDGLRVTFINHATTLLQLEGLNILTDPIWSDRCSPVSWAGPHRVRPPGLRFEDLPPIDLVLISHNHYDHLDLPTLKELANSHAPRILTGLGNAALLTEHGIGKVTELDWWQSTEVAPGVRVHAVPVQHSSNRGLTDTDGTLWVGFVIEAPSGKVYFAGDTGWGPHFEQVFQRFGPMRLAMLPIGAFRPEWFMARVHVSPAEAVQAHLVLGARKSVAIHWGTFRLADDGELEPPQRLDAALLQAQVPFNDFWVLGFGEGRDVPPLGGP